MRWMDRLMGVKGRIVFADGRVVFAEGAVPPGLLNGCRDIASLHRVRGGSVKLVGQGKRARLRFSGPIPESAVQAILNVWTPPSGGGGGARAAG